MSCKEDFDAGKSNLTTVFLEMLLGSQQPIAIEFSGELVLRNISASQVWIRHFDDSTPNRSV